MAAELEISGCSVVLLGQFNPAIFHPAWLAAHDVVTQAEADESTLMISHPEIAQMVVGPLTLSVEQSRCSVATTSAPLIRAADFISEIFSRLLPHTPITQAGLNTQKHYRLESEEARNAMGRRLAPVSAWGAWGERLGEKDGPRNGVQIIAMREYWDDAPWKGWLQVKVEPSTQIGHNLGVYLEKNFHVTAIDRDKPFTATDIVTYVAKRFDDVLQEGAWIDEQLFAQITDLGPGKK